MKGLRVLLAILFFIPTLLYFVDFANLMPNHDDFLEIQLVPALLAGSTIVLFFQLALVLIFGRIYCSSICPAGILQDVINRIDRIIRRRITGKKMKSILRFRYHKPKNVFRYVLLGLTFVGFSFGIVELLLLFDPYSNFGRIATNLIRPFLVQLNNLFAIGLTAMDNYTLYQVTLKSVSIAGFASGLIALSMFVVMVVLRGRLFCNTLCPVGALLSLFSRFSLFRIAIDKSKCVSCMSCERVCKAEAIDVRGMTIHCSSCVDCFNCISSCKKDALHYQYHSPLSLFKKKEEPNASSAASTPDVGKRHFFVASAAAMSALPGVSLLAKHKKKQLANGKQRVAEPIVPPGALSLERFKDTCTACQLCVVQCPSEVLRPSGLEYGLGYLMRPYMSFDSTFCNYHCKDCIDVCPTGALKLLTIEEKQTTQVGIAHFYPNRCVVSKDGTDCGACSEHCPTQAVKMVDFRGSLRIPQVNAEICIGCGGCESICPVKPRKAIAVLSQTIHRIVKKPEKEKVREVKVDDFGF